MGTAVPPRFGTGLGGRGGDARSLPVKSACKRLQEEVPLARQIFQTIEELTEGSRFCKAHGKTLEIQAGFQVKGLSIIPPGRNRARCPGWSSSILSSSWGCTPLVMSPPPPPWWHRESPGAGAPVGMGGGLLWWMDLSALRPLEWPGISNRCDMRQSQSHLEGTQSIVVNSATRVSYRPGGYPAGKPPAWDSIPKSQS